MEGLGSAASKGRPLGAAPAATLVQSLVLGQSGTVRVTDKSVVNACNGDFGIYAPINQDIFANYNSKVGQTMDLGPFPAGTELVFYISPYSFCAPNTYLSTDPNHAHITELGTDDWEIAWEDWTDYNYTDLIVGVQRVTTALPVQPTPTAAPSFDKPYSSTSADPVITSTGRYTYSHTDMAIPGRGPIGANLRILLAWQ